MTHAGLTYSADFHLASARDLITASVPFLPQATAVFVNAAEFATLRSLIDPGQLAVVVVPDGPREATLLRHGRITATIQPPGTSPVEVTGAGDTLAGTFLAGVTLGASDGDALRAAVSAAAESIREPGLAISDS